MVIDAHAHYVPPKIVERLRTDAARYGIDVVDSPQPACACLHFHYGLHCRPFFPRLLESADARKATMARQGVQHQVLSGWVDVFGHGLPREQGVAWHRLMNEEMARFCQADAAHFSMLASGHMPDAAAAARELEHAVRQLGAKGGVVACNVEGVNLGELPLDEYWAAAVELGVPVFLHPTQPAPTPRSRAFALNQVVQYTFDTSLAIGSLMWSGVLDRFPALQLMLSHGGGALPYLVGRYDLMHDRSPAAAGLQAKQRPSEYMKRLHYDTILHDAQALRYLREKVGVQQMVLGTDDSFPPADNDPLRSLREAEFGHEEIRRIGSDNPAKLFGLSL